MFKSGNSDNYYSYVTTPQKGRDGIVYDSQMEARLAEFFHLCGVTYKPVYATFHAKNKPVNSFRDIKGNGYSWNPDAWISSTREPGFISDAQHLLYVEAKPIPYPSHALLDRMSACLDAQYGAYDPSFFLTVRGFQVYLDDFEQSVANPKFIRLGWDCGFNGIKGKEICLARLADRDCRMKTALVHPDNTRLNLLNGQTYAASLPATGWFRDNWDKAGELSTWKPYKPS
jgi:hypothetical protein